jgi:putative membrane protein
MMWWYGGGGGWWVAAIAGLVLVTLIVVIAVWATTRMMTPRNPSTPADASLQILRERFARGEISQAEFEEAKRVLGLR